MWRFYHYFGVGKVATFMLFMYFAGKKKSFRLSVFLWSLGGKWQIIFLSPSQASYILITCNCSGWKRPVCSLNPATHPALPRPPLDRVPKCYTSTWLLNTSRDGSATCLGSLLKCSLFPQVILPIFFVSSWSPKGKTWWSMCLRSMWRVWRDSLPCSPQSGERLTATSSTISQSRRLDCIRMVSLFCNFALLRALL